ncbi:MAG: hypothetical protein OXC63_15150 [Aestuariivita sp.]|nr:hypothetical protein [Aestuariivita sp.]
MNVPFSYPQDGQLLQLIGERATVLVEDGVLSVFPEHRLEDPPLISLRLCPGMALSEVESHVQDS